jgi:hypothetical protein
MLNGKEKFADRPEVMRLLEAFEKAHNRQDELALAIIATRLKREHNVKIVADNEQHNTNTGE